MSSSEDDYMSDKFSQSTNDDIRPGLLKRKHEQREHELYKKKIKSVPMSQNAAREIGLNTAIKEDNVGFKMLAKMGYEPGTSLGKSQEGIIEPLKIDIQKNKTAIISRIDKNSVQHQSGTNSKIIEHDFKQKLAENQKIKMIRKDYFKAQLVCYNLDQDANIDEPLENYYWPKQALPLIDDEEEGNEDEDSSEEDITEYLNDIIAYVRTQYFYCMYCVTRGIDDADLNSFCPGVTRDEHDLD